MGLLSEKQFPELQIYKSECAPSPKDEDPEGPMRLESPADLVLFETASSDIISLMLQERHQPLAQN